MWKKKTKKQMGKTDDRFKSNHEYAKIIKQ